MLLIKRLLLALFLPVLLFSQISQYPANPIDQSTELSDSADLARLSTGAPSTSKYSIVKIAHTVNGCDNANISAVVFAGVGLDDAASGGTYTGSADAVYVVIIDGTGTPDTFKWQKDGGAFTETVAITGSAQTLSDGITITFTATTGHTATDQWTITVLDYGCWQKNGVLDDNAAEAAAQTLMLFEKDVRSQVTGIRVKGNIACTGVASLLLTMGLGADEDWFDGADALTIDLVSAVSPTNYFDFSNALLCSTTASSEKCGAATNAIENVVVGLTVVDGAKEQVDIDAGCAVDIWVETKKNP